MAAKKAGKQEKPAGGRGGKRAAAWRRARRALKWLGVAAALLLAAPVIQVACMRWIDPPGTPLMFQRQIQARLDGRKPRPVRYRWLPLERVPESFQRYVLVAEDSRFFIHDGFDWVEMQRAMEEAKRTGNPPRGASTVTMQCARSLFLAQGRSWMRKALEAYYTLWMERILTKRRILELYVNVIEMGDQVYGIGAAAQTHFDADPRRLSDSQLAYLAAMLPSPLQWDPAHPSPMLKLRQQRILERSRRWRIEGFPPA